jgi:hypothetical protein
MAFSSITDARTKLLDPKTDVSSQTLYASNGLLDSTTVFYINSSRTTLASAGNYVIPTEFKSYYVTLGADSKIVGSKTELITTGTDTSWVDDRLMNYSADSGQLVSNNWFDNYSGGTNYTLNTSSLLLTDTYWTSRPYTYEKRWIIDQGILTSTAPTNIDLSDMKGYDLFIRSGEYKEIKPNIMGFTDGLLMTAPIHLAADPNRVVTNGSLTYTFRPDYFIPKPEVRYSSYFRRMPDALPIYDRYGYKKEFMSMTNLLFDCVVSGSGVINTTSRTFRNPTRHKKGLTKRWESFFVNFVAGQVSGVNANYTASVENGNPTANISEVAPAADRLYFDTDTFIRASSAFVRYGSYNRDLVFDSLTDTSYTSALLESLLVTDPGDRASWTYSAGTLNNVPYSTINPYQWTTQVNSGISNSNYGPANGLVGIFNPASTNAAHVQWDFEAIYGAGTHRKKTGEAYDALWNAGKTYATAQGWPAQGGLTPTFSNYSGGIYVSQYFGGEGVGWLYAGSDRSVSQVKSTALYSDYHNYYINGTINRTGLSSNFHEFYEGAINSYELFFCSNYLNDTAVKWYFYNLVHSYDVSKKIIIELLGSTLAKAKKVQPYCWRLLEPIDSSDIRFERKGFEYGSAKTSRLLTPPSFNQSLTVWAFAYCDGLFLWDNPGTLGGEYNQYPQEYTVSAYIYGDLQHIDPVALDWYYIGYWQVMQHRDIISADTAWEKTELYWNGVWTSNTDANTSNYPIMLYNAQAPISAYKLSADGTEALLIITNPYNNGYTKASFTVRLPSKGNQQFTVDTWGLYTSVIRIKNL